MVEFAEASPIRSKKSFESQLGCSSKVGGQGNDGQQKLNPSNKEGKLKILKEVYKIF